MDPASPSSVRVSSWESRVGKCSRFTDDFWLVCMCVGVQRSETGWTAALALGRLMVCPGSSCCWFFLVCNVCISYWLTLCGCEFGSFCDLTDGVGSSWGWWSQSWQRGWQGTNIGESMCIFMCLGKTIVKHLLLWGSFGRVSHFLSTVCRCLLCTILRLEYCFSLDLVAPVLIYIYLFSFKSSRV